MFFRTTSIEEPEVVILTNRKEETLEEAHILLVNLSTNLSYVKIIYYLEDNLSNFNRLRAIIFPPSFGDGELVKNLRESLPTVFLALMRPIASENPSLRLSLFEAGANMVAHDMPSLVYTLEKAVIRSFRRGHLSCPYCGLDGLSEDELWHHFPAFHINWENSDSITICPICSQRTHDPLQVHIHELHGPIVRQKNGRIEPRIHARSYTFSLVVCKHPIIGKYLLCQEFANQGFWLPGGAVDAGESLTSAAIRETKEEAGIDIDLKGILGIEYDAREGNRGSSSYVRMRIIFYAEPKDLNQLPKSCPDFESAGACWCSEDDIKGPLRLRGSEVMTT